MSYCKLWFRADCIRFKRCSYRFSTSLNILASPLPFVKSKSLLLFALSAGSQSLERFSDCPLIRCLVLQTDDAAQNAALNG